MYINLHHEVYISKKGEGVIFDGNNLNFYKNRIKYSKTQSFAPYLI